MSFVTVRLADRTVRIQVEDTGIGISAEKFPHIFDRFYRVRASHTNAIQGLGLGLSFVSWIVKAHGGTIDVVARRAAGLVLACSCRRWNRPPLRRLLPLSFQNRLPGNARDQSRLN